MRAFEIQSDWDVTRMLRMAAYPPDKDDLSNWFSTHPAEWADKTAFRFAILDGFRLIGVADLDEIAGDQGELGYWLERDAWGKGYASEAAGALVEFASQNLGLLGLRSGHAADNAASGGVLTKLGFRLAGEARVFSRSRGREIDQRRYALQLPRSSQQNVAT